MQYSLDRLQQVQRWWVIPILLLQIFAAIFFESRAFFFSLTISSALIFCTPLFIRGMHLRFVVIGGLAIVSLLSVLVFGFKTHSSRGRWFIYKRCLTILKDSFPEGVGSGKFSFTYGNYQAQYFESGAYSQEELLLADSPTYAFNDYLQILIETGLWGVVSIVSGILLLSLLILFTLKTQGTCNQILLLAIANIFTILIAAIFTHVFESLHFQILFFLSITVLVYYAFVPYKTIVVVASAIIFIILTLSHSKIRHFIDYTKMRSATDLYNAGFIEDASLKMDSLYEDLSKDPTFLSRYIDVKLSLGKFEIAEKLAFDLILINNTSLANGKLAYCLSKNHKKLLAEQYYKKAINLVPNRLHSREQLFEFYISTNQLYKAQRTGHELMSLPIKIISKKASDIKKRVATRLRLISSPSFHSTT